MTNMFSFNLADDCSNDWNPLAQCHSSITKFQLFYDCSIVLTINIRKHIHFYILWQIIKAIRSDVSRRRKSLKNEGSKSAPIKNDLQKLFYVQVFALFKHHFGYALYLYTSEPINFEILNLIVDAIKFINETKIFSSLSRYIFKPDIYNSHLRETSV